MEREQGPKKKRAPRWSGCVYKPADRTILYVRFKVPSGKWVSMTTRLKAVAENWARAQALLEEIRERSGVGHVPRPHAPASIRRRGGSGGRRRAAYKTRRGIQSCEACSWTPPDGLGPSVLNVHHVKPRAKGGDDSDENMVALCPNCHATAHALLKAGARHGKAELVEKLRDCCPSNLQITAASATAPE